MGVGEVVHAISGRFMHTAIYGKRRRWRSRFSDLSIQAGSLPFLAPVSSSSTDSFSPLSTTCFNPKISCFPVMPVQQSPSVSRQTLAACGRCASSHVSWDRTLRRRFFKESAYETRKLLSQDHSLRGFMRVYRCLRPAHSDAECVGAAGRVDAREPK